MASLAQYRALARRRPQWEALPAAAAGSVEAGDRHAGAALLRTRPQLLGDLDPAAADAGGDDEYGTGLADAARRFQARHGSAEDGVPGPQTIAARAIPPAQRAIQLALTLEHLCWLPPLPRGRMVAVDLPAYRLWAVDSGAGASSAPLEMRIIVGTPARTQTPLSIRPDALVGAESVRESAAQYRGGRILPKLARDPGYPAKNDMELLGGGIAGLRTGTARIRQRSCSTPPASAAATAAPCSPTTSTAWTRR